MTDALALSPAPHLPTRKGHGLPALPGGGTAPLPAAPPKPQGLRGSLLAGALAVTLGLGGTAAFLALVPVAAAVVAPGVVAAEGDRKKLQHPDGGIIREIAVREGQAVTAGQVLFRLEPLRAEVDLAILDGQVAAAAALEARLAAERDGADAPTFPTAPAGAEDAAGRAEAGQRAQFAERRASLAGQAAVLEARVRQAEQQAAGHRQERAAAEAQLSVIDKELADTRGLLEKGLALRTRVLALERERARLAGLSGQALAATARAEAAADEARRSLDQLRQGFAERVADELAAARERLAELRERARVARDALARVEVRAPADGVVQALAVSTLGEVVQPGAVLLEVAPAGVGLVVSARVRPQDADGLAPGMAASLRFPALPARTTPVADGVLDSVSRDRLVDPATGEPYFLVRARVADGALPPALASGLVAGMPAEVVIPTEERTLASYLLRPLGDALARGLRER